MLHSKAGPTIGGVDAKNVQEFVYCLLQAAVGGGLKAEKVAVAALACGVGGDAMVDAVTDAAWCLYSELEELGREKEKGALIGALKACVASEPRVLDEQPLKDRMPSQCLVEMGLTPLSLQEYTVKERRARTKMFYKQT